MTKLGPWAHVEHGTRYLIPELAKRHEYPQLAQKRQLSVQEDATLIAFNWGWFVGRGSAPHGRGHIRTIELQAIIDMIRVGLIRKTSAVK